MLPLHSVLPRWPAHRQAPLAASGKHVTPSMAHRPPRLRCPAGQHGACLRCAPGGRDPARPSGRPAPPAPPVAAEEERGSAAKWALLQALLARGLRHAGGSAFLQAPVLLTHAGDEMIKASRAGLPVCKRTVGQLSAGAKGAAALSQCGGKLSG